MTAENCTQNEIHAWHVGVDRVSNGRKIICAPVSPSFDSQAAADSALMDISKEFPNAYIWHESFFHTRENA